MDSLSNALLKGIERTWTLVVTILVVLGQFLVGKIALSDLAGPIGIAQISGQASSKGFYTLLYFTGFISINLGVVNLLPLPALDGGRLVFVAIEAMRRKPIDLAKENKIHQYGLMALLLLMAVISVNDVVRIITTKFIR